MVAYSYKRRFIPAIEVGLGLRSGAAVIHAEAYVDPAVEPKLQTIRAEGKKRHARPGEEIQLYFGLRTKHARLIGRARCTRVRRITITFGRAERVSIEGGDLFVSEETLNAFARRDGFRSWDEMREFWREEHGLRLRSGKPKLLPKEFRGLLIEWEPL